MASKTDMFRPPWAVMAWADDLAVYVELPMEGTPYIQRFPLTEAGLSKALNALRTLHRQSPTKFGDHQFKFPPKQPGVKRIGKVKATDDQREIAKAILKKQGLL